MISPVGIAVKWEGRLEGGLVMWGGTPYGVLCYGFEDRGCRERLAVPPAIHRPSLRDGVGAGEWTSNVTNGHE